MRERVNALPVQRIRDEIRSLFADQIEQNSRDVGNLRVDFGRLEERLNASIEKADELRKIVFKVGGAMVVVLLSILGFLIQQRFFGVHP